MRQGDFLFKRGTTRTLASYWLFRLKNEKKFSSFPSTFLYSFVTNVIATIHIHFGSISHDSLYLVENQYPPLETRFDFWYCIERVKRIGLGVDLA